MGVDITVKADASRGQRRATSLALWAASLTLLTPAVSSAADDAARAPVQPSYSAAPTDTVEEPTPPADSGAAAAALPLTAAPFGENRKAQVRAHSLFDDARRRTMSEARADVHLFGPVSLHGGALTAMAGSFVSPLAGAQLRLLSHDRHAIDGALSVSYVGEGFNLVRAAEVRALIGRHFGDTSLFMNVGYSQGLVRNERYVDLRLSAQQHFYNRRFFVGLDSRMRHDAEIDADEPAHEPEMDLMAGPAVGVTLGPVAITGFGGLSAVRYRDHTPPRTGFFAGMGLGTVLF